MEKTSNICHNTALIRAVRVTQVFNFEQLLAKSPQKQRQFQIRQHQPEYRDDQRQPGMPGVYFHVDLTKQMSLPRNGMKRTFSLCPACHNPEGPGDGNG